jgi:hypothetical protein
LDRIIASYAQSFAEQQMLDKLDQSIQFEHFANYCVVFATLKDRFDTILVTTDPPEAGIDGVAFLFDDTLVASIDEAESIFSGRRKDVTVRAIFVQAKRSEPLHRDEVLKFSDAVKDFISDAPKHPMGSILKEARGILDLVIKNVGRVSGGRPECIARFVTTGSVDTAGYGWAALRSLEADVVGTGLFASVDVGHVHKEELIRLWNNTKAKPEAKLDVRGLTAFPTIRGVNEAYIAIIPAKDFIEQVLCDQDGELRSFIFDENVRAFLGQENDVNAEIAATLGDADSRDLFSILNNGITIISPDVRVQGNSLFIRDFQIVNGCQTSNVLFRCRAEVDATVMVTARVIEVEQPKIVGDVIRATNNQTRIDDVQFLSLKPIVRKVEAYFDARGTEQGSNDTRLYFERRSRQYVGQGIPDMRIFDMKEVSRAVAAMFMERPDLAARYPTQMFEELSDRLLAPSNEEAPYFAAAMALYNVHVFTSNKRLPSDFRKFKWHFLLCLKHAITGASNPPLNDRRIIEYSEKIIRECQNSETGVFDAVVAAINSLGAVDRDRLKTTAFINDLKKALHNQGSII